MAFRYPTSTRKAEETPAPATTDAGLSPEWANPAGSTPAPEPTPAQGGFYGAPETASSPFEAVPAASAVATRNVLNSDVSVVGVLRFTDDLLIDGSVEGEITSDGVLTVGANATIQAGEKNKVAVRTKSAIIHGVVTGDIVVTDRVELAATAQLVGDVTASKISIQEGATFIGHCMVGVAPATMPAPVAKKGAKAAPRGDANLLG